jgi:NAD(P)-dependent dehydrogenase (short-subunit alcohol dehydrogenase family)
MFMKMSNITFDYQDKTVIVFGGSRGIGKEVCKQFLHAGANVHCASRTDPEMDGIKFKTCDIAFPSDIHAVFDSVDGVDFVINVAGTNLCEPIDKIDLWEWDRLMEVNLRSFFMICKRAVECMRATGGRIVNVSSIAGRSKSIVSGVHYTSSKYGIIGLTKQLAHEVSQFNILVNCVCPSQTLTEMLAESMTEEQLYELAERIPVRRVASTTEQALPILFLCSDAASYITGAALDVNGGQL